MSLSGAKGCESGPLSVYCHTHSGTNYNPKGTDRIFKLAPSNNNNHPHTSASERESNLFACDIGKISSLFFFLPISFSSEGLFSALLTSGRLNAHQSAFLFKLLLSSQRSVYLDGYSTLHGCTILHSPDIYKVV